MAQAAAPAALGIHGAGANASVSYSFQVIGGNPGDVVPILIATTLTTTGTDPTPGIGFAALTVNTSAVGLKTLMAVCTDGTCGTTANSFSGTLNTLAKSGAVDELFLQVQASVVGNSLHSESASASADPFIFVDPAFLNASLYSIVVCPGVGNASALAVPEPGGIWPMLAVGFAAIGFTRVRHRRRAVRVQDGIPTAPPIFRSPTTLLQTRGQYDRNVLYTRVDRPVCAVAKVRSGR